ncbi:MAG: 6-phosphogluconolactonase [Planktomarina sp.]|nr:6-phosphogluconolactonase [Planktomarina sp.]MDT2083585.1 6-phosphogluconolactonase [Planktomarina sp.]|tara:strand:- start:716 stop:1393 length:678 start_codon:yes stop_codon:yes gene_type:complete
MLFRDYKTSETLMQSLASTVEVELSNAIKNRGLATFVVPGGTTPKPFFNIIRDSDIEWEKITIFPTDERWVSMENSRSNARLIQRELLTGRASKANFVTLYKKNKTLDQGASLLAENISNYLPIDVLVLGMGVDMHTASLFPGSPGLALAQSMNAAEVVPVTPLDNSLEPRVTLSARVLEKAVNTHVLIIGLEKKNAVKEAEKREPASAPISQFLPNATVHWSPV